MNRSIRIGFVGVAMATLMLSAIEESRAGCGDYVILRSRASEAMGFDRTEHLILPSTATVLGLNSTADEHDLATHYPEAPSPCRTPGCQGGSPNSLPPLGTISVNSNLTLTMSNAKPVPRFAFSQEEQRGWLFLEKTRLSICQFGESIDRPPEL